jgi:hypothetical protein
VGSSPIARFFRRGGQKSGLSRRLRKQRELEEKIASSKNGAAIFGLYRTQLDRERALERERRLADAVVEQLMAEADRERAALERLRQERRNAEQQLAEAARQEAELRGRLASPDGLAMLLAEVPEERLEEALVSLGHELVEEGEQ